MKKLIFGSFTWPNNPTKMTFKCTKNLKDFFIPNKGDQLQSFGQNARILTGEGEFFGTTAFVSYFRIYSLFEAGIPKDLFVPGFANYMAYLTEFNLVGEPGPETVKYTFTFIEDVFSPSTPYYPPVSTVTAQQGDTLWSISNAYGVSVYDLVKLNPTIKDTVLTPGKEISLQ